MTTAELLKTIRKEFGISQEDLAHELGISYTTINRWENSRRLPSRLAMRQIKDFCAAKGVSEEILKVLESLLWLLSREKGGVRISGNFEFLANGFWQIEMLGTLAELSEF
ncbi:MAG: helix-turn-helix transcriptional regulator [Eubacteriaceae bacterium]|nr:helix-turn-helix transcriptional regulator [Eubacteriaceae bacterium]